MSVIESSPGSFNEFLANRDPGISEKDIIKLYTHSLKNNKKIIESHTLPPKEEFPLPRYTVATIDDEQEGDI